MGSGKDLSKIRNVNLLKDFAGNINFFGPQQPTWKRKETTTTQQT